MPKKITPCLLYTKDAAKAARYYTSIFKDSKIRSSGSMATSFRIGGM
ncbi:MAG: VOC family protein, partial [Bdellovibrionota bacterium]